MTKIYIDTAEGKAGERIAQLLRDKYKRNVGFKTLAVGDYYIEHSNGSYVVERKTVEDLVASMKDQRDIHQMNALAEVNGILIIVGNPYNPQAWVRTHFKFPFSVTRYLTGLAVKTNASGNRVTVLTVPHEQRMVVVLDYLASLLERDRTVMVDKSQFKFGRRAVQSTNVNEIRLAQLSMLPKINRTTAKKIMDHFGWDYQKVMSAPVQEFEKIKGIGKVLAERIYQVYHAK